MAGDAIGPTATAPSGFHAKPVNTQLRSHSLSVHSAAKARMKNGVAPAKAGAAFGLAPWLPAAAPAFAGATNVCTAQARSEEHTYELKSLMRTSYAVFCLKKK